MTLLYYNPLFLEHETGNHPERPARLQQIIRQLQRTGLVQRCVQPPWQPVSDERLARVHSLEYARAVRDFAAAGGGRIEVDTVVSSRSYDAAALAAGAASDAVERVVRGEDQTALCVLRPPGHHALAQGAMGFCLFNHVAVAARVATEELGLARVLIVDWDVHHGNGTQDTFWNDGQVGFFSIHRHPFYPGTGSEDETGHGRGLGATRNVPVTYGTPPWEYLEIFRKTVEEFADKLRPQLIILSAGFDSHRDDPVGGLDLEMEDFRSLTQIVLEIARVHAGGRVVSVLEGGYNAGILAGCVEIHLYELLGGGGVQKQA